jgi:hypothetical protein
VIAFITITQFPEQLIQEFVMSSPYQRRVSKIIFPLAYWRYAILFQSLEQFASWLLITLAVFFAAQGLFLATGIHAIPPMQLLIGTMVGSLVSVFLAAPARFHISPAVRGDCDVLRAWLCEFKYREVESNTHSVLYEPKLPKALRWKENNVRIQRVSDVLEVSGGHAVLRQLHKLIVDSPNG